VNKFLADENVPPALIEFLRDKGFDVKDLRDSAISGSSDSLLIDLARQENRVLVTFDKHFGNILLYPLHTHHGIIRIRIHPPLLSDIVKAFERFLSEFDLETIKGTLIVLEREGFRVRRTS